MKPLISTEVRKVLLQTSINDTIGGSSAELSPGFSEPGCVSSMSVLAAGPPEPDAFDLDYAPSVSSRCFRFGAMANVAERKKNSQTTAVTIAKQ